MIRLLAVALLGVTAPLSAGHTPGTASVDIGDGSVVVSVRVLSAIGWSGDQPVVLGFARPQAWAIVVLDGADILMLI